jgi:hypothetical protein
MTMNEYDRMCEDPEVNEDGHRVWPGFDWANPGTNAEDMREALAGYEAEDGTWEAMTDDEEQIDALFEYLADPKHRFDIDERNYSAKNMYDMFEARCVPYEGWYQIGHDYLEDHYPGLVGDPLACMHNEDIQQVGANIGGSEHETERYLWVEADDGRVFCIVRPAYADAEGARK